jgi:hypothetical protein
MADGTEYGKDELMRISNEKGSDKFATHEVKG